MAGAGFDFDDAAVAAHYDELPLWSAPFGQLILDRVPLRRGQTVLDVGAGTGFLGVELAQRCGPGSTVIAVDPWRAAMAVLADKCRYLGLTDVECRERDAADTGCPAGSVDVAVSNLGINNFTDPAGVLAEIVRVLRPGGTLVMTSNLVGHMAEFYDVFGETLAATGHRRHLPALEAHVAHRATVDGTVALLRAAGFDSVEASTGSFGMRFADGTSLLRHHFIRLGFVPGWRDVVPPDDRDAVFAELQRRLDDRARTAGELRLTIPTACFTAVSP